MVHDPEEIALFRSITLLGNLTQRHIAQRMGVSELLVSLWKHGKRKATERNLADLRALNAQITDEWDRAYR